MDNRRTNHSWMNSNLEVRNTGGGSNAVFAYMPVQKDERLAIFGGYIMPANEEPHFPDKHGDFALQIDESFVIGPRYSNELEDTDYFNHSCNPNSGINGQIFLVAMRDIAPGEEITFDYAMVLHKTAGVPLYEMVCSCGSANCRGTITDNDWRLPELQKRYNGWFSWYLQDKIDRRRGNNGR